VATFRLGYKKLLNFPGEEDKKPGDKERKSSTHGEYRRPGDMMPAGSGEDGPEKAPA
jgi:hypothetical protein